MFSLERGKEKTEPHNNLEGIGISGFLLTRIIFLVKTSLYRYYFQNFFRALEKLFEMLITFLPHKTNTTVQMLPIVMLQWNYPGFIPQ